MRKRRSKRGPPKLRLGELRLAWLVTFLTVVRLKNRSVAGKELNLTQGAVTKQLQSLEDWSRMVLLRPEHPVELTAQGEAFVKVAEEALELLTKARAVIPLEPYGPPKPKIPARGLRAPPSVPKAAESEPVDAERPAGSEA